jgi:5-methylcytosine-specific restriction endonuclease McrA
MKLDRRPEMLVRLRKRDGDRCFYCRTLMDFATPGLPNSVTIEHLIPRTDRGGNRMVNLVLAGSACNTWVGHEVDEKPHKGIVDKIALREFWPCNAPRCTP